MQPGWYDLAIVVHKRIVAEKMMLGKLLPALCRQPYCHRRHRTKEHYVFYADNVNWLKGQPYVEEFKEFFDFYDTPTNSEVGFLAIGGGLNQIEGKGAYWAAGLTIRREFVITGEHENG